MALSYPPVIRRPPAWGQAILEKSGLALRRETANLLHEHSANDTDTHLTMNTRKLLVSLFIGLVTLTSAAFAQTQASATTVARFSGNVTAHLPDGSSVAVTQGMQLPQGASLITGAKSEAYLVTHGDSLTVVTEDSEIAVAESTVTTTGGQVTEEKTTIDLKSGNLVAKLNPAKKSVNNYSVRTPKGVAAARGTVFTVRYNGRTYKLSVAGGNVSFTSPNDGTSVTVRPNRIILNGIEAAWADPKQVSSEEAALTQKEMAVVVATLAVAAANNIGGTTRNEFTQVLNTIISAAPQAAAKIAALVAVSAPSLSSAVTSAVQTLAPDQSSAVQKATERATNPPAGTTAPQPIDPGTVSRSG